MGTALALVGASSLVLAAGASAAEFHPTNEVQLEEAVTTANGNAQANKIVLAGQRSEVYRPHATLHLTDTAGVQTIEGPSTEPGAELEGGAVEPFPSSILTVESGVSAALNKVSVATGGGLTTPAIEDSGTLTLEGDAISGNNYTGVLVPAGGTLTARNTTISGSSGAPGVIDDGTASLFNSTVAFNQLGGVENAGTLHLTNTIVAENHLNGQSGKDCLAKAATTSDHSLDSDGSCGVEQSNKTNVLQEADLFNGGPTPLHSLRAGSPAIDQGNPATCLSTDQRGQPRPDPEPAETNCDIGADEYDEVPPTYVASSESPGVTKEATSSAGAVVTFPTPTAVSHTADLLRSNKCAPLSGTTFAVGVTTVTCTVINGHESTATASFKVSVMKPEAPVAAAGATTGVAVNSEGDIWVSEWSTNTVKEFSPAGTLIRGGVSITSPCTGTLNGPFGVAVDSHGNLWVTDSNNARVVEFNSEGTCLRQFGSAGRENGQFNYPTGIAIGPSGNVWVTDTFNERVQEFTETGTFVTAIGGSFGSAPGQFEVPEGIAVDSSGHLWVSQLLGNHVDELSESGAFLGRINAQLPSAVAVDASGNVWIAELDTGITQQYNSQRQRLGAVGSSGSNQGQVQWPHGLAVDSTRGNVWLADEGNPRVDKWIGADPPGAAPPAAAALTHKTKGRTGH
jgi:streptogramin lyase